MLSKLCCRSCDSVTESPICPQYGLNISLRYSLRILAINSAGELKVSEQHYSAKYNTEIQLSTACPQVERSVYTLTSRGEVVSRPSGLAEQEHGLTLSMAQGNIIYHNLSIFVIGCITMKIILLFV